MQQLDRCLLISFLLVIDTIGTGKGDGWLLYHIYSLWRMMGEDGLLMEDG